MLGEDEVDDYLYYSRAGEAEELKALIEANLQRERGAGQPGAFNVLMRDIAAANEPHNTLLHFAAANGHRGEYDSSSDVDTGTLTPLYPAPAIIDYLVPQSDLATLLAQNESGNTALHWASLNGHIEVVQALVKQIDELTPPAKVKDYSHLTDEERDVEEEKDARERSVWDVVNHAGKGPMSEAQMNGQETVVAFLLQHMIAGLGRASESEAKAGESSLPAQEETLQRQADRLAINEE